MRSCLTHGSEPTKKERAVKLIRTEVSTLRWTFEIERKEK